MGNNASSLEEEPPPDPWWPAATRRSRTASVHREDIREPTERKRELEIFKEELARKKSLRQDALAAIQSQLRHLQSRVEEERKLRRNAEKELEHFKTDAPNALQAELEKEREENKKLSEERVRLMEEVENKSSLEKQVQALKDVSQIGKEMLKIRELQVKELKKKLVEINISSVVAPPEDLRLEYEKQIDNIRKLRTLYEERSAATQLEHRRELEREEARITVLETKLSDLQKDIEECQEIRTNLELKVEQLECSNRRYEDEIENTKEDLLSSSVQNSSLNSQLNLINNLFSQMLVNPEVDLDRLTRLLKEHHGLITDLTNKGDTNEVAALLVDLAEQIDKEQPDQMEGESEEEIINSNKQLQTEISSNLSKVWRVMIELLSHHQDSRNTEKAGGVDSCYKSVQTPTGPRSVISVSQTFLTLKDLILEKNKLVKEVGRLKTLNNHLENRLGSQEKRLSVVTTELRKTWSVVNKLKAQHKQLHTHKKILRYELQQKRCMLTELKGELQHCKEKWQKARQKNCQTEEDWKTLRKEFAERKSRKESNSAESGYEEEDVQTPPSEPNKYNINVNVLQGNELSEPELLEEDPEQSEGNSFDTVIDLLDIECLDSQSVNGSESDVTIQLIPPTIFPLTGSEFTEGLDQIESEDLAAVLDVQYQTQLLGADYNLSLPSSGGSSPILTDNDELTLSEVDISEEDLSSIDNQIHLCPIPQVDQAVSEDALLFGSNSSKNISRFLDGLFVSPEPNKNNSPSLDTPSTSRYESVYDEFESSAEVTPLVGNQDTWIFSDSKTMNEDISNRIDDIGQPEISTLPHSQTEQETDKYICTSEETGPCTKSHDEIQAELLKGREDRLKRLELQCRSLVSQVTSSSFRSQAIANKLDQLHLTYGPPPETNMYEEHNLEKKVTNQGSTEPEYENNLRPGASTSRIAETVPLNNSESEVARNENPDSTTKELIEHTCQSSGISERDAFRIKTAKLKRLESQCKSLCTKRSRVASRSLFPSNEVDGIHNSYKTNEGGSTLLMQTTTSVGPTTENTAIGKTTPNNMNGKKLGKQEEILDCKIPDIAAESKDILIRCSIPSTSVENSPCSSEKSKKERSTEEILEARSERFKRLEDQCKSLLSKMTATSLRSEIISNKLDELHSCYGMAENTSDGEDSSAISSKRLVKKSFKCPLYFETSNNETPTTSEICNSVSEKDAPQVNVIEAGHSSRLNGVTEGGNIMEEDNTATLDTGGQLDAVLPNKQRVIVLQQPQQEHSLLDTSASNRTLVEYEADIENKSLTSSTTELSLTTKEETSDETCD